MGDKDAAWNYSTTGVGSSRKVAEIQLSGFVRATTSPSTNYKKFRWWYKLIFSFLPKDKVKISIKKWKMPSSICDLRTGKSEF